MLSSASMEPLLMHNPHSLRYFGLDLMRTFAIILVVLSHGAFLLEGSFLDGFPYIKIMDGVDLFFVLSGFLIGGILLKEINRQETFGIQALLKFLVRRWFRTLPNYYLILLLNVVLVYFGIVKEDISMFNWKFLLFAHNLFDGFYGFFWESWSLSVEEWFYLIFPVLSLFVLKFVRPMQTYFLLSLAMILIPLYLRHIAYDPGLDDFWFDVNRRKVVVFRLDSIAYGLLAAWINYYFLRIWKKISISSFILGILLILLINTIDYPSTGYFSQVFLFSITPLAAMLFLPLLSVWKSSKSHVAKGIVHISRISYSMYLINLGIVAAILRDNIKIDGGWLGILMYLLFWISVVFLSGLLYRYFEKPVMDLRDRFG